MMLSTMLFPFILVVIQQSFARPPDQLQDEHLNQSPIGLFTIQGDNQAADHTTVKDYNPMVTSEAHTDKFQPGLHEGQETSSKKDQIKGDASPTTEVPKYTRVGHETATVVSAYTYTERSKPSAKPKPKPPTDQGKPTASKPNPGKPGGTSKPPGLTPQLGDLSSSLIASGTSGSHKPNKPLKPGSFGSLFGSYGTSGIPGFMFGSHSFQTPGGFDNFGGVLHPGTSFGFPPWALGFMRSKESSYKP
ncbi:uncharacterized protein LOC128990608 [Macrosteles quadrilineatus]|uniref:uncharacterized protein LOC128990608 n=1 Tax=Macrosteles quadrilineatus TaxID=74068 RepID=UPI0023E17008|nr:uncharacterized protein LOC128990608 [Macrosteles quadrilineatus]